MREVHDAGRRPRMFCAGVRLARNLMGIATVLVLGAFMSHVRAEEYEGLNLDAPLPFHDGITHHGVLPNGMRYMILPHKMPADRAELMFHIGTGSINETESERGLAHYLEHMAFNGSTHHPPGSLVKTFESHGMKFGRDQNAFTGFDQTTYLLSLPNTKPETLDMSFTFFADVGSGLTLPATEVERERGVILEEERMRDTVSQRMIERIAKSLAPGSRFSERFPIGLTEVIKQTDSKRLRGYYDRCYRPDVTTLIVVGDVDGAQVEARIRKAFAEWKRPDVATSNMESGIRPSDGFRARVMTDPDVTQAQIAHIDFDETPRVRTLREARGALIRQMGASVLSRRLQRMVQRGEAAFLEGDAMEQPLVGRASIRQVAAEGEVAHWRKMAEQLLREQRRMLVHGALQDELDRARKIFLTRSEAIAKQADAIPSNALAMQLNQSVSGDSIPMSFHQSLEMLRAVAPTITLQEVNDSFRARFGLGRGLLLAVVPQNEGVATIGDDALHAVYTKVMAEDLTPIEAAARVESILEHAPTTGEIKGVDADKELGVETWTLANAIPVFVKPLDKDTTAVVTIKLYGGMLHEDATTRGLTALADPALTPGTAALSNRSSEAITRFLEDKRVRVSTARQADGLTITVSGVAEDLEPGLALVYGLLTNPVLEETAFKNARADYQRTIRDTKIDVQRALGVAVREVIADKAPRATLPSEAHIGGLTLDAARAWLARLATRSAMGVAIAGKFTPEQARAWMTTYLASLPPREESLESVRKARGATFGGNDVDDRVEIDTASPAAWVFQGWRGYPHRDVEAACAANVATRILGTRLLQDIREKRGLVYTIQAAYSVGALDGVAHCQSYFSAPHDKLEVASNAARAVGVAYGSDAGPTDEELATVQKTILNRLEADLERASHWSATLAGLTVETDGIGRMRKQLQCMRSIDAAKVRAAAKEIFQPDRFFQIMVGPKGALPKKKEPVATPK